MQYYSIFNPFVFIFFDLFRKKCNIFLLRRQTAIRWQYATETRNNLLAAQQNIVSAQRYLNTIDFPYCRAGEKWLCEKRMKTAMLVIGYRIYVDLEKHAIYTDNR